MRESNLIAESVKINSMKKFALFASTKIINNIWKNVLTLLILVVRKLNSTFDKNESRYDPEISMSLNITNIIKYKGRSNLVPIIKYKEIIKNLSANASK